MGAAARVFVSYQSGDDAIAKRLVSMLEQAGHSCWHMTASIDSGADWANEVIAGIGWCSDFVLLFGAKTNDSEHVADEVAQVLKLRKRVHPLRITQIKAAGMFALRLERKNWVDWNDLSTPPSKLLETLASRPARDSVPGPEPSRVEPVETVSLFVDRLPERDALRVSLEQHLQQSAADYPPSSMRNNVLTYYGFGGQGKSRLSRRLERWIAGRLPEDDRWGQPPRTAFTARWNLDEEVPRPQPISFLIDMRRMLARTELSFASFDVAVAALYTVTLGRVGEDASMTRLEKELLQPIRELAWKIGADALPETLNQDELRRLVDDSRSARLLDDQVTLAETLTLIRTSGSDPDAAPRVVAAILDHITGVLAAQPVEERPTIAIFLDTFEKVQNPQGRAIEQLLNALVVHLPFCLFVITGRERLTWHEPESAHLRWFGPDRWPSLARHLPDEDEPRQHELNYLSLEDTKATLAHTLGEVGWQITERELEDLATETQGWPLHIEILSNLIRERHQHGRNMLLSYQDLRGSFPALVRRLLEHLSDDVQLALQAAAVVPSFDKALLRACDPAIKAGSVIRLLRTSLVSRSEDPYFPHKLHDELRRAVRVAGAHVDGGWEEDDRRDAAERVALSLETRWQQAMDVASHAEMMHIHAVAVTICLEYGLETGWVKEAFQKTPSHVYQRALLPNVDGFAPEDELRQLVQVYRFVGLQSIPRRLAGLQEISLCASSDLARFRADLWTLYSHRNLGDYESARRVGERMLQDPYSGNRGPWKKDVDFLRSQHAGTLAGGLWWDELRELDPDRTYPCWAAIENAHGNFAVSAELVRQRLERHHAERKSYRFQMELQSKYVWRRLLAGEGQVGHLLEELATYAKRFSPAWLRGGLIARLGPWAVQSGAADPDMLWGLLKETGASRDVTARGARAWFATGVARSTGNLQFAAEVREQFIYPTDRSLSVLHFEFFFEYLGMSIPPSQVKWLEDRELVRKRWLEGWERILIPPEGWEYSPELYGW